MRFEKWKRKHKEITPAAAWNAAIDEAIAIVIISSTHKNENVRLYNKLLELKG